METKKSCPWCGGEMKKLYHAENLWSDNFSFDQKKRIRFFICADCGRVKTIPVWSLSDDE